STPVPLEITDGSFSAITVTTKAGAATILKEVSISGMVKTPAGLALSKVAVNLTGGSTRQTVTTPASGAFSFKLTQGQTYSLAPSTRTETAVDNGITTLDIVQI